MENKCPMCQEVLLQDGEYKGVLIYMCINRHRVGFIDEEGNNAPAFKLEGVADESSY